MKMYRIIKIENGYIDKFYALQKRVYLLFWKDVTFIRSDNQIEKVRGNTIKDIEAKRELLRREPYKIEIIKYL